MTKNRFDDLILNFFPHPLARIYSTVQESKDWRNKVHESLRLFEFGLRYYTLLAASQYLYRTKGVSDPKVDTNLLSFLQVGQKSLGPIQETLFSLLKAQQGQRDQFYIKEMYDWYWDTSYKPHRQKRGVGSAFNQLIELRNQIIHYKVIPQSEDEWKSYHFRIVDLLDNSLGTLAFLKHYKLVRVEELRHDVMVCKDFTGLTPDKSPIEIRIQDQEKIPRGGWLCISQLQPDYLQVHPLIVFLQSDNVEGSGDIALLENFDTREAVYIQPQIGNIQIVDVISDLINFVRGVLEERLGKLIEYDTLDWDSFCGASKIVTTQKTSLLQSKYDDGLYLQRQSIKDTFDDFLNSSKSALVLIGNSGIGKSSFLTSVIKEYTDGEKYAIIAYDGANLDPIQALNQSIENDLGTLIRRRGIGKVSILDDLPLRTKLETKKVIILIDAINENGSPRDLLVNVNRFIIDHSRYNWIKLVITSRPQAWRMMKRGVKLADPYYYYSKGGLDPWVEMLPFSWQEVQKVYGNYQKKYDLQTGFDDLAPDIKANIRDPLFLQLVSRTWKGLRIPSRVSTFQVYQKYIDTLIEDGVLRATDLDFLELELMPNFISWNQYHPSIPRKDLQQVRTKDGRPLLELVENRDYAGDTPINVSFVHLVDVGLLEQRGSPRDYEVRFKFERFFDYFVGKRLYEVVKGRNNNQSAYQALLQETLHNPWLWGGVKNALILELQSGQYELIKSLIHTEDSYLKDLIVVVLEEYGEEARSTVGELLLSILNNRKKSKGQKSLIDQIAGKGAVEAAYRLNFVDVLEAGCFESDPAIRSVAIQQLWRYWREKGREDGFQSIRNIISKSTRLPRLSFDGLESAISISLLILFENSKDQEVTSQLRDIWKPLLQKILLDTPTNNSFRKGMQSWVRNLLPVFASGLFTRLTRNTEEVKYWLNMREIQDFLELSDEQKLKCAKVLDYIDPDFGDLDEIFDSILDVAKTYNVLAWYLLVCVFVPQASKKPVKMVPLMQKVYWELAKLDPVPPAIVLPTDLFAYGLDPELYGENPQWMDILGEMAWNYIEKHDTKFTSRISSYQYLMAGVYFDNYYRITSKVESELQKKYLDHVLKSNDIELIRSYTRTFSVSAVLRIPPRIAMNLILPIVDYWKSLKQDDVLYSPLAEILVEAFTIVRSFKVSDVDDFMLENDIPVGLQQKIKANTIEKLGNILGIGGTRFAMDSFLANPLTGRRDLIKVIFTEALKTKSTKVWFEKLIKVIVNAVYGDDLFARI